MLIFVVIPLGVIIAVSSLVLAGGDRTKKTRRYRPGRPYDFQPIWFLASPEQVTAPAAPAQRPAVEGPYLEDTAGARVLPGPVGGASDSW